jgi:Domain of Unknown Function (DUF1080)
MKNFIGLAALALLLVACGTKKSDSKEEVANTSSNTLTEQQAADGWKLLFDGKTMNGWRSFKNKENNTWEVVDGMLHCKSPEDSTATNRGDIVTTEQYENFEFTFDWKIAPTHNSGVMFRVTEEYEVPYATGPEYQVIDDQGYPSALKPAQLSAANYDMHVPENKNLKPVGEWNSSRIVVNGNQVEHWLNGSKVVAYELGSEDWKKKVADSKWKDFPGYGLAKKGHLDLQDHGGEVWYKNLYIKVL